jgi:two-component system nitrogen regulation response regulator GlnG
MVQEKTFREDLYYRLNVVRIQLPPLRDRIEDVPQLIDFVLKRLARDSKADTKLISPEALALLNQYRWPGNVRELENIIYRSAVLAQGEMILIKDLPQEVVKAIGTAVPSAIPAETNPVGVAPVEATELLAEETLLGQPAADPYDAVYKDLRDSHETNILEHAERALIARALDEAGGKQVKAAEILGMTRATLRKRIDQYDLA